jgi:transposase
MGLIRLAKQAQTSLLRIARSRSDKRRATRAKVLLGLHNGQTVQQIADEVGISRQAVYNLQKRYLERREQRVQERLNDAQHTGRPPEKQRLVMRVISKLLRRSPRRYGYDAPDWTVPLLHEEVQKTTGVSISRRTIRRALNILRR